MQKWYTHINHPIWQSPFSSCSVVGAAPETHSDSEVDSEQHIWVVGLTYRCTLCDYGSLTLLIIFLSLLMHLILSRLYVCFLTYICFRSILNLRRPEWDESKRLDTIRDRGIDFSDAVRIFGDFFVEKEDVRQDYGEVRIIATGMLDDFVVVVVYTVRLCRRRIISVRRAHRDERLEYRNARKDW